MFKSILGHSMLTLALCALTPACVAPADPDAGNQLIEPFEPGGDDGAPGGVQFVEVAEESGEAADESSLLGLDGDIRGGSLLAEGVPGMRPEESEKSAGPTSDLVTPYWWGSPYKGGNGGGYFLMGCAEDEIATGIFGRSGSKIDQLGLVCTYLNWDNSFGPTTLRGPVGGSGGNSFLTSCPANHAIIGFGGGSGSLIERLNIICDTIEGTLIKYSGPSVGGWGGTSFSYTAPRGYFLTSLEGQSGSLIDGFRSYYNWVEP